MILRGVDQKRRAAVRRPSVEAGSPYRLTAPVILTIDGRIGFWEEAVPLVVGPFDYLDRVARLHLLQTFVSDITTAECRALVKRELQVFPSVGISRLTSFPFCLLAPLPHPPPPLPPLLTLLAPRANPIARQFCDLPNLAFRVFVCHCFHLRLSKRTWCSAMARQTWEPRMRRMHSCRMSWHWPH